MLSLDKLFEGIEQSIPNDFPTKFSYIDLIRVIDEKSIVTEDTTVIYFKSANNPDRVIEGNYAIEYQRMVINVYTHRGESGVLDGLDYCKRVCECLDKVFNKVFNIDGICFTILDCKRLGNYNYLGPTKQGIQTFSINYLIKYEGGN